MNAVTRNIHDQAKGNWVLRDRAYLQLVIAGISVFLFSCEKDKLDRSESGSDVKNSFPFEELREGMWPKGGLDSWERHVLFRDVLIVEGRIEAEPSLSGPYNFQGVDELNSEVFVKHGSLRVSRVFYCDNNLLVDGRIFASQEREVEFPCFSKVQLSQFSTVQVELSLEKMKIIDHGIFVISYDEFLVSFELIKVVDESSEKRLLELLRRKLESQEKWNQMVTKLDFSSLFSVAQDTDE